MTDNRYNGWTNYETWNLALWLGNDEGSYDYWQERSTEVYRDTDKDADDRREDAAITLADQLKDEIEENSPAGVTGFYADILSAAISEVNWYEIARHWIDDVADDIDAEEKAEADAEAADDADTTDTKDKG